jgi:hypothetical protein
MIGASRCDPQTYEDLEADRSSTGAAVLVVVIASIAGALGTGTRDLAGVVGLTCAALVTWGVWIALTLIIGRFLMPGPQTQTDFGELLRTTGFSASPGVLRIFASVPVIGLPILLAVTVWILFTFVAAVRHALDFATFNRAIVVCLLGWIIHGLLFFGFVMVAI